MTHFSKYATGFPKEYVLMMDANMLDIFPILNFWWEEGGMNISDETEPKLAGTSLSVGHLLRRAISPLIN